MHPVLLDEPALIPVVELDPSRFGTVEMPAAPWTDNIASSYWSRCLSQSGLGHLQPLTKRSWLVRLSDLNEPSALRVVLRSHFDRLAEVSDEITPTTLSGGFALYNGSTPIFLPQCCGRFADLKQWELAARHRGAEPAMVWIGHPCLEVRFQSPYLLFAAWSENGAPPTVQGTYVVDPALLADAAAQACILTHRFASQTVVPLLAFMGIPSPSRTAAALLGTREQAP
jgi:hypothetical protein